MATKGGIQGWVGDDGSGRYSYAGWTIKREESVGKYVLRNSSGHAIDHSVDVQALVDKMVLRADDERRRDSRNAIYPKVARINVLLGEIQARDNGFDRELKDILSKLDAAIVTLGGKIED